MTGSPDRVEGTVLVIGESLIDAVERAGQVEVVEHVGGSPANVAWGLGRLGHQVELATWFGTDARGERIARRCRRMWVRLTPGSDRAEATSVARALIDSSGAATYQFDLAFAVPPIDQVEIFGHLHAGSISATIEPGGSEVVEVLTRARTAGSTVSYDINARPSIMGDPAAVLPRIEALIGLADVVKASDEDIAWLYPDVAMPDVLRRWRALGERTGGLAVVTLGAEGALVALAGSGELARFDPVPAEVVDTVGAGDSFMAGLLSGLLDAGLLGRQGSADRLRAADLDAVRPAVERATATSSLTVRRAGAFAPTRQDLAHL